MQLQSSKFRVVFLIVLVSLLLTPLSSVFAMTPSEVWVDPSFNFQTPGYEDTHFDNIQDAVDAVSANGTVYVAAGTYNHFYVSTSGVSVIASAGAIVDGNVMPKDLSVNTMMAGIYVNATGVTIDGFTVQNWSEFGIYVAEQYSTRSSSSWRILPMDPDPILLSNVVISGNHVKNNGDGIVAGGNGNSVINNTVENNDWLGIGIVGKGCLVQGNTMKNNGEFALYWWGEDFAIEGNTASGSTVGFFGDGGHHSVIEGNTAYENLVGLALFGEGNTTSGNTFRDNDLVGIYNLTYPMRRIGVQKDSPNGNGMEYSSNEYEKNMVTGNGGGEMPVQSTVSISQFQPRIQEETISGAIYSSPGAVYRYNHIDGNEGYGLFVMDWFGVADLNGEPEYEPVDALLNWWGHTSGPYHPCTNPYAVGQEISNDAEYSPWLLSEPSAPKPLATKTDYLEAGESVMIESAVSAVVAAGQGTVTVGQYSENPVAKSLFGSVDAYVDVYVTSPHEIEELVVYLFYEGTPENEDELILHWWNGSDWVACSESGVNLEDKYVWAVITADSVPSLSDLTGTEFGAGLVQAEDENGDEEPIVDLPDTGGAGYTGYGLLVMAAGFYLTMKKKS